MVQLVENLRSGRMVVPSKSDGGVHFVHRRLKRGSATALSTALRNLDTVAEVARLPGNPSQVQDNAGSTNLRGENGGEIMKMTRLTIIGISFIVISLMLTGISSAKIDPKTAAGIWLFDEGSGDVTKDFSGNGNDGKLDGPTWVKGKFGNALSFDVGKFVDCGDDESLSLGDSHLTIGAWIKQKDIVGYQMILTKGKPGIGANKGYRLRIEEGGAPLFTVTGDTETDLKSGKPLPKVGEWYHVVGVKDATNMTIYVNGEAWGARGNSPPGSSDNDVPLQIGRLVDNDWYFHGIIDEVFIFPIALSLDDIKTIMDKGFKSLASVFPSGKLAITWGQIKSTTLP